MKVSSGMTISIIRKDPYVVNYFDKHGRKIGYCTTTLKNLDEMKNQKIWCGTAVHSVKVAYRV